MIAKGSEKIEKGYKLAEKEEMSGDESDLEDDDVDEGAEDGLDERFKKMKKKKRRKGDDEEGNAWMPDELMDGPLGTETKLQISQRAPLGSDQYKVIKLATNHLTYCTVLYCTVLYCTVLYCTVLYCTVPSSTLLYSTQSLSFLLLSGQLYCILLTSPPLYCPLTHTLACANICS